MQRDDVIDREVFGRSAVVASTGCQHCADVFDRQAARRSIVLGSLVGMSRTIAVGDHLSSAILVPPLVLAEVLAPS
jgi:hypothetical protein